MVNDTYGTFIPDRKVFYDRFWEGPLKQNRSCTNRFWLIFFSMFLIVWITIAIHAFRNGNIEKLIVPTDSAGRKCGIDLDVQDKPYLLFFDLRKCTDGSCNTTQLCQKECPTKNFLYRSPINSKNLSNLENTKKEIICTTDININLISEWDQLDYYIAEQKCTKWYLKSKSNLKRCIPEFPIPTDFNETISNDQLKNATAVIQHLVNLEKSLENIYEDIIAARYTILGFIIMSGIAGFFYIILLKWFAKSFVYISIFSFCTLLVYFIYESSVRYSTDKSSDFLYVLIFCIILLIVVVLTTLLLRKKIDLACQIIKESSKAITCIWSTLFFPIIPWLLHVLVLLLAIAIFCYLQTISIPKYQIYVQYNVSNTCICPTYLNYVNNASCDPITFKTECTDVNGDLCSSAGCYVTSSVTPNQIYIYHLINILALLWLSFFISAFGQMVLGATFATWYWTFNKRDLPKFTLIKSFWITLRYHIGTLAFGSLVLWICEITCLILKSIGIHSKTNGPRSVQPINCIKSLFDFLISFLQYINRNAYIMCAVHGKDFCYSAKYAFNLVMRNVLRVVVVTNITDWILRIGKYFIVILTTTITIVYYSNKEAEDTIAVEVPAAVVLIGSYLITTVFFTIYKTVVDTLFLCFLEDSEQNDGSTERPHYMSTKLKQLLTN